MEKNLLRQAMQQRRRALAREQIAQHSREVAARVRKLPEYLRARTIALYASIDGEPDLTELAVEGIAAGATVCYPRIDADVLCFVPVSDPSALRPARFNIPAPGAEARTVTQDVIDVYLVPGLAFDLCLQRLGHGLGFYDVALRGARGFKVGVGHDFQVVDVVPASEHDIAMDAVVTETRVLRRVP